MKNKKIYIILGIIVCILTFSLIALNSNSNEKVIATSSKTLSNKKISWGIKRAEEHAQPDLGSNNLKLLKEYNGIAIGNKDSNKIYLTFDSGYEGEYTSKILEILKKNNVKATFFITAHYLNTATDLVKKMVEEGHDVR